MQKEKLSALIDDEILDDKLLDLLSKDKKLQKSWQNYHLIGDTLRHELADPLCLDMSDRVAKAIKNDPVSINPPTIESATENTSGHNVIPFWQKMRPWLSQLSQITVAASVSLIVILGGQYQSPDRTESPVLNLSPMIGSAPVSFGLPSDVTRNHYVEKQAEEDRNHSEQIEILHQFELRRRTNPY